MLLHHPTKVITAPNYSHKKQTTANILCLSPSSGPSTVAPAWRPGGWQPLPTAVLGGESGAS